MFRRQAALQAEAGKRRRLSECYDYHCYYYCYYVYYS